MSVNVCTYGTGAIKDEEIHKIVVESGLFDFRPGALDLKKPDGWYYRDTANYGHFGRVDVQFSWERTDKDPPGTKTAGWTFSFRGKGRTRTSSARMRRRNFSPEHPLPKRCPKYAHR